MDEAPRKKRGRMAAAAGVAAVAIAVPVSGAFAESSSSSSSQQGSSGQQAPGFDDVQSQRGQDGQRTGRDCPEKDGQGSRRGGSGSGSSGSGDSSLTDPGAGTPYDAQQL